MTSWNHYLIIVIGLTTTACSAKSASPAPPVDPSSRSTAPTCEGPLAGEPRVLHSHLIIDEVEPFSSDVTVVLAKQGDHAALTHRFWERDGGLWASERFDPVEHLGGAWGDMVDPSRARPELVTKLQLFFEPWGYDVAAVYTLSEGRRIRAREFLPLPGRRVDVRTVTFNASRDLSSVSAFPSNTGDGLGSNAPLSEVSADLSRAQRVGPVGGCVLASLDRDSDAYAELSEHALVLARGETPHSERDTSTVPANCEQQLQWQVVASAPRTSGGEDYERLTFSFPAAAALSPSGASSEVRYAQGDYGFTATATVTPVAPPEHSCGEFPLLLHSRVSLLTARGGTYEAEVEFAGVVAIDGERIAVGHFVASATRAQLDSNGEPQSIIWHALKGYPDYAMRALFADRLSLAPFQGG